MSLIVTSLNSGSNGNCYYIGNDNEAVLIDVGISCKETEHRMKALGLSINKVKAIFVSHEHTDHTAGIPSLSEKYSIPVFVTTTTARYFKINLHQTKTFITNEPVTIGELSVTAFTKYHDAVDPHNFVVSCKGITAGVFTDIGRPCQKTIYHFTLCHAAFLEANYDEELLEKGRYPYFLKNRIRGGNGHLSNMQALDIFSMHRPPFMTHLFLSHLSHNNNCPELVEQLFKQHAEGVKIIVASRYKQTDVYKIEHTNTAPLKYNETKKIMPVHSMQLALF